MYMYMQLTTDDLPRRCRRREVDASSKVDTAASIAGGVDRRAISHVVASAVCRRVNRNFLLIWGLLHLFSELQFRTEMSSSLPLIEFFSTLNMHPAAKGSESKGVLVDCMFRTHCASRISCSLLLLAATTVTSTSFLSLNVSGVAPGSIPTQTHYFST